MASTRLYEANYSPFTGRALVTVSVDRSTAHATAESFLLLPEADCKLLGVEIQAEQSQLEHIRTHLDDDWSFFEEVKRRAREILDRERWDAVWRNDQIGVTPPDLKLKEVGYEALIEFAIAGKCRDAIAELGDAAAARDLRQMCQQALELDEISVERRADWN